MSFQQQIDDLNAALQSLIDQSTDIQDLTELQIIERSDWLLLSQNSTGNEFKVQVSSIYSALRVEDIPGLENVAFTDEDNEFSVNQTFNALIKASSGFSTGDSAATSGAIRLENSDVIAARNSADSGNRNLMYLDASNIMQLGESIQSNFGGDLSVSSDVMFVDISERRVGIGTNSPTRDLTVYSTSQPVVRVWNSSNVVFDMIANTTNGTIGTLSSHPLRILTNSSERIVLAADGSVIEMNGTINIDPTQSSLDVGSLDAGNIYLANNSGSSLAPTIASRTTSNIGFSFLAATANSGTITGDMSFTVRENDNSDFSDLTQIAFKFDRFGTSLFEILRNGNFDFKTGTATFGAKVTINSQLVQGVSTDASGVWSVALNNSNTSSGGQSFSANVSNLSDGSGSSTFGNNNFARATSEMAIGRFGTDYVATGTDTDRLLNIGNGDSTVSRSDALTVFRNGNLKVVENIYTDDDNLILLAGGVSGTKIDIDDSLGKVSINTDLEVDGTIKPINNYLSADGSSGWTGSWLNNEGATVTVKNGIITDVS